MFEEALGAGAGIGAFFLGLLISVVLVYMFWYFTRKLVNSFERITSRRFAWKLEKYNWKLYDKNVLENELKAEGVTQS